MALTPEQVGELLKMIRQTKHIELTCPECVGEMDRYAQRLLDGEPRDEILELVRQHLEACPPCHDEFNLIMETLKAIEDS